jgi:WD40 repeat protein/serine/threonine protein kinase
MNPRKNEKSVVPGSPENAATESGLLLEDPRVVRAVEEYQAALEAGNKPDRGEFLERHAEFAAALAVCLDSLEFVHTAGSQIHNNGADAARGGSASDIQPEGPLGDFRILREIGRGGMGLVYEAVQISLGRRVALKVLPFAAALDSKQLQRFKNEAQAAAQLHHTNIVPVYGVGCERGLHYYAMQYIEGQTVAALIRELRQRAGLPGGEDGFRKSALLGEGKAKREGEAKRESEAPTAYPAEGRSLLKSPSADLTPTGPYAPQEEASSGILFPAAVTNQPTDTALASPAQSPRPSFGVAEFFHTVAHFGIQAAEALEHAHSLGIIHRDIKPANLMVEFTLSCFGGEGRREGLRLWITDFGLAHCQGGCELTLSGELLGTLRYMSPEQALAKRMIVDERTDIYSLGVTLYELLTLEPAFAGTDRQEVLRKIAFDDPKPPRRLNKAIPWEMETIVLKAMEKNPDDRYATAQELVDDLGRYLEEKPIRARRPTPLQRARKFARRHRGVTVTTILFTLGLLVTAVAALAVTNSLVRQESGKKSQALQDKEEALQKERAARADARRNLYVAHMNLAQAHWENANVSRVEELLELFRHVEPGQKDLRGWEWYYQDRLCHAGVRTFRGHEGWVLSVAFSPDGSRLATGSNDQTVKVWEVATGRELRTFQGNKDRVTSMAFSPDGKRMATGGSQDNTVKLWDVVSGKELLTFQGKDGMSVFSLAFNSDGTRLARGDGSLKVWDVASGDELCWLGRGFTVALSPDGTRAATSEGGVSGGNVNDGFDITVWDVKNRKKLGNLRGHNARVTTMAFSPDGNRLASGSFDKTVKVWDSANGKELRTLQGHSNWIMTVTFSPDGTRLASGSSDQTVKVWEESSGKELRTFRGHNNWVTTVAFSPDGKRLASGSSDQTVKVWDVETNQEFRIFHEKLPVATSVAFSPDGNRLASGSYKSMMISDVNSGKVLRTLPGGVDCVTFSPDGTRVATGGSHDRSIRLWDVASGKELQTILGPIHEVRSATQINTLAFSPDGKYLASGSHQGAVKLWDVAGGKEIRTFEGAKNQDLENMVWRIAFSPDGTRLACNHGKAVKLWEVKSGKELSTIHGHKDRVLGVAFSPDGALLASCGCDRTVMLWDLATGRELRTLRGHRGEVHRVAFSPDGTRLASCSNDHTVKVWDLASGQELRSLRHEELVHDVAFSPEGKRLASASGGTVTLWEATKWTEEPALAQPPATP